VQQDPSNFLAIKFSMQLHNQEQLQEQKAPLREREAPMQGGEQ
jgi:hypothetical protein